MKTPDRQKANERPASMNRPFATFHFDTTDVTVTKLNKSGACVLTPSTDVKGHIFFFRGGTGGFGKLTLDYLRLIPASIARELSLAVVCFEYGEHDQHGGEPDLNECNLALKDWQSSLDPKNLPPYKGAWGVSSGCTHLWRFLLDKPQLHHAPIVFWCPVYDFERWMEERIDVRGLFKKLGIDKPSDFLLRSAKAHLKEIAPLGSKFCILGAAQDVRTLVGHALDFGNALKKAGADVAIKIYQDEHCLKTFRKEALEETRLFLTLD